MHAQLSSHGGKFVFSGTFHFMKCHFMWVEMGQGFLLCHNIFLHRSDQLCINIT